MGLKFAVMAYAFDKGISVDEAIVALTDEAVAFFEAVYG